MYFINKKTKEKGEILTKFEEKIIFRPDDYESSSKSSLIKKLEIYKQDFWLVCPCSGSETILVICSKDNNLYLRCKNIHGHEESCFFSQKSKIYLSNNSSLFMPRNRPKTFDLYKNIDNIGDRSEEAPSQGNQSSVTKLGKMLYAILQDSKSNIITYDNEKDPTKVDLFVSLKAITKAFTDPQKKISKDILLGDYYRYSLKRKNVQEAGSLLEKKGKEWPIHLKPFFIFTTVAKSVESNVFNTIFGESFEVENPITLPSTWISKDKSKPYFLIASALLNEKKELYFKNAFAMPIQTIKSLMPVESNYERLCLLYIVEVLKTSPTISYTIEKPLFCLYNNNKKPFRPDFIVFLDKRTTIFIEVLGMDTNKYCSTKKIIQERAEEFCDTYLSVEAYKGLDAQVLFKRNFKMVLDKHEEKSLKKTA